MRVFIGQSWRASGLRLVVLLVLFGPTVLAHTTLPEMRQNTAQSAARETGVPTDVLRRFPLSEPDRGHGSFLQFWLIVSEGTSECLDGQSAPPDHSEQVFTRGAQRLDFGCLLIKDRWHQQTFELPAELLDPLTGARYTEAIFHPFHQKTSRPSYLVVAYHSCTPDFAGRHGKWFDAMRARLARSHSAEANKGTPATNTAGGQPTAETHSNSDPFLRAAAAEPFRYLAVVGQRAVPRRPVLRG